MNKKFFYADTDSIHCKENKVIEELAFMDEKLDKILEQQELIMKKLSILNKDDYIADEDFDGIGETLDDYFIDALEKLDNLTGITVKDGE